MLIEPIKYNVDWTGEKVTNHAREEEHDIGTSTGNRALVLTNGAYYTRSLILKDKVSGRVLVRDHDYNPGGLIPSATARSGKEACGFIVITNPEVSETVVADYQFVGGFYVFCIEVMQDLIKSIGIDDRKVSYYALINRPLGFKAGMHFHDLGDIYGFTYVVYIIEKIRDAIIDDDAEAWNQIYLYLNAMKAELMASDQRVLTLLAQHLLASNPHKTTAASIGAASTADVEALKNELTNHINALVSQVSGEITSLSVATSNHINDRNNPHQDSLEDVNGVDYNAFYQTVMSWRASFENWGVAANNDKLGSVWGARDHQDGILRAGFENGWMNATIGNPDTNNSALYFYQSDDGSKAMDMRHTLSNREFTIHLGGQRALGVKGGQQIAKVSDANNLIASLYRP